MTLVWSRRAVGEGSRTRMSCRESQQPVGTDFNQNSRPYIILKLPRDPHSHASPAQSLLFYWSWVHPLIAGSPLVTAYIYSLLIFR